MDVVDGRVRVLVVAQMDVLHGQQGQLVSPVRVASVLHVAGNLEQLRGRHPVGRGVRDDGVGGLEGDGVRLAESEGTEGAAGRVLVSALQGESPGTAGELLLLPVVQPQPHHRGVGHDTVGHLPGGLRGREQLAPH